MNHKFALHRIGVHVLQFLSQLVRTPHVKVVKSPLPKTPPHPSLSEKTATTTVTAEVASSSLVVPGIQNKDLVLIWKKRIAAQKDTLMRAIEQIIVLATDSLFLRLS
jgi:hypothetical protein